MASPPVPAWMLEPVQPAAAVSTLQEAIEVLELKARLQRRHARNAKVLESERLMARDEARACIAFGADLHKVANLGKTWAEAFLGEELKP